MTIIYKLLDFTASQLFGNLLLSLTIIVAYIIGRKQIRLNDVVEIFGVPSTKEIVDAADVSRSRRVPIILLQNVGTRLVYLDSYIFNGVIYKTHGQVLPPTYSQSNSSYWIDLPTNGTNHASVIVYYRDLDKRQWKSEIIADLQDNSWKAISLPRINQ